MKFKIYALAIVTITCAGCNRNQDVITPQSKPLIEAVYAAGVVAARDEYEIFAQVDGYMQEKLVADGDAVKKGDVLFIIDNDQQSARFKITQETFNLARKNAGEDSPVIAELTASVASVKSKLQFDSLNYARYSNLIQQNATTKVEYERFKLSYENTQNEYALQQNRLRKIRDQLAMEFQNAKSQLQIAADESGRYLVRSEVAGKIFRTTKEKGELIRRGELLGVAGQDANFFLKLNVDELDIQRIQLKQKVKVKIDAYPGKFFTARIDKIYPMVNLREQSLQVDASLDAPLPGSYSGLAVEANIIIHSKDNAIVIPKAALISGDSVIIIVNGDEKKVKVTKGIETLDEVEIIAGIEPTQEIILKKR
jgi:HlyD family secretion protein